MHKIHINNNIFYFIALLGFGFFLYHIIFKPPGILMLYLGIGLLSIGYLFGVFDDINIFVSNNKSLFKITRLIFLIFVVIFFISLFNSSFTDYLYLITSDNIKNYKYINNALFIIAGICYLLYIIPLYKNYSDIKKDTKISLITKILKLSVMFVLYLSVFVIFISIYRN